ncbi:acyltransferase [Pseudomonas fluorescens]|uniref:acyltransferase family protein n=1 Tax=Pseudomonas fluorescens TaxID=294 RepID=UPI0030DB0187
MKTNSSSAHNNCFDSMRHIAALSVLFGHHFAISALPEPMALGDHSIAGMAVLVFFSISGYLVYKSFLRCSGFIDYLQRRSLRIFPAYLVCVILMVYILGYFYSTPSFLGTILSAENFKYLISYGVFVYPTLPHIFEGYHLNLAVNGSLWTLPVEFACYLGIGFILSLQKDYKAPLIATACCAIAYVYIVESQSTLVLWGLPAKLIFSFGASFFMGAFMSATEKSWNSPITKICLTIATCALIYAKSGTPDIMIYLHLLIPVAVIILGVSFQDKIIAGRFDISYGLYIYAFPVQQIVVHETRLSFWPSMFVALAVTITLAAASWLLIERPCIRLNRDSRKTTIAQLDNGLITDKAA